MGRTLDGRGRVAEHVAENEFKWRDIRTLRWIQAPLQPLACGECARVPCATELDADGSLASGPSAPGATKRRRTSTGEAPHKEKKAEAPRATRAAKPSTITLSLGDEEVLARDGDKRGFIGRTVTVPNAFWGEAGEEVGEQPVLSAGAQAMATYLDTGGLSVPRDLGVLPAEALRALVAAQTEPKY